jgi:hypothetical protein
VVASCKDIKKKKKKKKRKESHIAQTNADAASSGYTMNIYRRLEDKNIYVFDAIASVWILARWHKVLCHVREERPLAG